MKKIQILLLSFAFTIAGFAQTRMLTNKDTTLLGNIIQGKLDRENKAVVTTISGLRATTLINNPQSDKIYVLPDGRFLNWNPTSSTSDNGLTVIKATAISTGRFEAIISNNTIEAAWSGAKGDGVTNDYSAIATLFSSSISGYTVELNGFYNLNNQNLTIPSNLVVKFKNGGFVNGNVRVSVLQIGSTGKFGFNRIEWNKALNEVTVDCPDTVSISTTGNIDFRLNLVGSLGGLMTVNNVVFRSGTTITNANVSLEGSSTSFSINDTTRDSRIVFTNSTITRSISAGTNDIQFGSFQIDSTNRPLIIFDHSKFYNIGIAIMDGVLRANNCEFKAGPLNSNNVELLHIATQALSNLSHRVKDCLFDGQNVETDLIDTYSSTNVLVEGCRFINHNSTVYSVITIKSHVGNLNPLDYENVGNRDGLTFQNNDFERCSFHIFEIFTENRSLVDIPENARKAAIKINNNNIKTTSESGVDFIYMYNVADIQVNGNIWKNYGINGNRLIEIHSVGTVNYKVRDMQAIGNQMTLLNSNIASAANSSIIYSQHASLDLKGAIISSNYVEKGYIANMIFGTINDAILSNNIVSTGSTWNTGSAIGNYSNYHLYLINNYSSGKSNNVGTTAQRPILVQTGYNYFDTDLGLNVTWNGTSWIGPVISDTMARNAGVVREILVNNVALVNTGSTTNNVLYTGTIPANTISANGSYEIYIAGTCTNNANTKVYQVLFNSIAVMQGSLTTTAAFSHFGWIANQNSTSSQVLPSPGSGISTNFGITGTTLATLGISTTGAISVTIAMQNQSGTDDFQIRRFSLRAIH